VAVLVTLVIVAPAGGGAGALDQTFGTGGKVTTDFGTEFDDALDVVVQPDGKIIAVGDNREQFDFANKFAVARYTAAGALDATFDSDGLVTTDVSGVLVLADSAQAVALQPDGKVVVAGITGLHGVIARYNSDGSLDTTFDGDGKKTVVFSCIGSGGDGFYDVAVQPDGKIVAVGRNSPCSLAEQTNKNFAVARLMSDGSLDATFDGDGRVMTDLGTNGDAAYALALQPDGKIVVAGQSSADAVLVRYKTDGSLDSSFDGDGKLFTNLGPGNVASDVLVQPDGKIIAAGGGGDFVLLRYEASGAPDTSFDGDGKATTDFGSAFEAALSVALLPGGKLIAVGTAGLNVTAANFALARYHPSGTLDTTFDGDGKVMTDFGPDVERAEAVAIQADEKVVAAGRGSNPAPPNDFILARYLPGFTVNAVTDDGDTTVIDGVCRTSGGVCTLRAAIEQTNGTPGHDLIEFSVGSGDQRIKPTSSLPVITDPLTIDGTTQPGYSGEPLIHLVGSNAGIGADGLQVHTFGTTVRGLGIHGFSGDGIELAANDGNVVELNHIGPETTPDPCIPVAICNAGGNGQDGVFIASTSNHKIVGNLISGNGRNGVHINGAAATSNEVRGNLIGTSPLGSSDAGNAWYGVNITGAPNNVIGGSGVAEGNVISGNDLGGVLIGGVTASGNKVEGNLIGTDSTGSVAVGNGDGVVIAGAPNNTIGGLVTGGILGGALGSRNVISGNSDSGIEITGSTATGNQVIRNFIGTDKLGSADLGNGFAGIVLLGAGSTTIQRNVISGNSNAGVLVGPGSLANPIRQNSIFGNGGLGIDLAPIGITFNDVLDADGGPNGLQNFPVLYGAVNGESGTAVSGYVDSVPNATYTVELFVSSACDPSGAGEGETFRHTFSITSDATGTKAFAETFTPAAPAGSRITATTTDSAGNTSEFSVCVEAMGIVGTTSALTAAVQDLDIRPRRALEAKVEAIAGVPNAAAACGQIGAFENQVDALRRTQLTDAEANLLDAYTGLLEFGFGCP
jgi:uncharacterized delta-60 repeat protein